ncbi:hypothetical protein THH46_17520 [Pseudomonas sp. NA13]
MQIHAREQGIALTLAQVYQYPTIAQLAEVLQAGKMPAIECDP